MNTLFRHAKLILAAVPLFSAAFVSGCGSGCGTLGVANTSSCGSTTSSAASATASTYSVSGTVSGGNSAGVTITLTGAATGSTTTDTNGTYTFVALPNGSYNVVPSSAGYTFLPVSTAVTISGANVTAASFAGTASAAASYTISGTVSGPVAQNVLINLTSGSITTGTAVTDASGSYSFAVVAGTYTVAPGLTGYSFTPASSAVSLSTSVTTAAVNFTEALVQ